MHLTDEEKALLEQWIHPPQARRKRAPSRKAEKDRVDR